ncbi:Hypothetical protein PHPALM_18292, partial [Phytophthora palmivora]
SSVRDQAQGHQRTEPDGLTCLLVLTRLLLLHSVVLPAIDLMTQGQDGRNQHGWFFGEVCHSVLNSPQFGRVGRNMAAGF